MSRESYDALPYPYWPFAVTHPFNLQTVSLAFGHTPPAIETARVLELGCATGGNIVPMACAYPDATFVGIDYVAKQIELARRFADAIHLKNIRLEPWSIMDVTPELGRFDYIIAHGVYSWVPAEVQDKILAVCRANLSENGVAYVSFNTLPGWHVRRWLRDLLKLHVKPIPGESNADRVKRCTDLIEVVLNSPANHASPLKQMLNAIVDRWPANTPDYVVHEYLEDENTATYFQEFAARATAHGLQYLADAGSNGTAIEEASPEARKLLDSFDDDLILREQHLDFMRDQAFRRALLVHGERRIDRSSPEDRIGQFFITSNLKPSHSEETIVTRQTVEFGDPDGLRIFADNPVTKAVLFRIYREFPRAFRLDEFVAQAVAALAVPADQVPAARRFTMLELMRGWMVGLIQLYATAPRYRLQAGDRPTVFAAARYLAASGAPTVTNLRHENVTLGPPVRNVVPLFDGTRTREQLVDAFLQSGAIGAIEPGTDPAVAQKKATNAVGNLIKNLASQALLVA